LHGNNIPESVYSIQKFVKVCKETCAKVPMANMRTVHTSWYYV